MASWIVSGAAQNGIGETKTTHASDATGAWLTMMVMQDDG
jgi:hypothetical protein